MEGLQKEQSPSLLRRQPPLHKGAFDFIKIQIVMLLSVIQGDLYCCFSTKNKRGEIHLALLFISASGALSFLQLRLTAYFFQVALQGQQLC